MSAEICPMALAGLCLSCLALLAWNMVLRRRLGKLRKAPDKARADASSGYAATGAAVAAGNGVAAPDEGDPHAADAAAGGGPGNAGVDAARLFALEQENMELKKRAWLAARVLGGGKGE